MTARTCTNPKCTCTPCLCGAECRCGGGTALGELEARVMAVVWAAGAAEVTAREVADALPEYAYTTVATVLNRLSRKGVLTRRLEDRTTRFTALGTRDDRVAAAMVEALSTSDDRSGALTRFAATMSADDAEVLRRALSASR